MPDIAQSAPVADILASHARLEGPLLPILHAVQAEFGYIPQDHLPQIAQALGITRAEVHGVVSFYHDFRDAPAARHTVKLCRAEACQAMGADALADHAQARLGADWHGSDPTGAVTLEPVFCLGLCACGPAALVDGQPVGRLTAARLDEILAEFGA